MESIRSRDEAGSTVTGAGVLQYLAADEKNVLLNIEVAFEAVRAVWSGSEVGASGAVERWKGLAQRDPLLPAIDGAHAVGVA